ncbi:hypothetical protein V5F49_11130 [Xanthobacter sp. V3C-3]|uniref:LexA family protein n=1 Tax=Xanthobacter lutulentifluminis TaxID=3119935 RepID=UPI00372BABDF
MAKSTRSAKSEAMRTLREAQQRYLETVKARTGFSFSEIGRRAKLSPTTVTRFMNGEGEGTLATLTISQIAEASGVPATGAALGTSLDGVSDNEAEPYVASAPATRAPIEQAIEALRGGRNAADPWVLRTRALEDAGYLPGDVVIVDLSATPVAGDAVCAQVYDWEKMRAETVFRIFEEPYLVGASRDPAFRKPMLVDGKSVVIKGVVTDLVRPRRAA